MFSHGEFAKIAARRFMTALAQLMWRKLWILHKRLV
jgi:hypothetical protein